MPDAVLVAGLQAAGKSTVAPLLARRWERAAYVESDLLYRMVVTGRADVTADPSEEALAQLRLRYRQAGLLAASFAEAGFVPVVDAIASAADVEAFGLPLRVVWLDAPDAVIAERERSRGSRAYDAWLPPGGTLEGAVAALRAQLGPPPPGAVVIDTEGRSPEEVAEAAYAALARQE